MTNPFSHQEKSFFICRTIKPRVFVNFIIILLIFKILLLSNFGHVKFLGISTQQIAETYLDSSETVDLLPGAKNIMVTNKNRRLYVDLYINYLLNERIRKQFHAFSAGFFKVRLISIPFQPSFWLNFLKDK